MVTADIRTTQVSIGWLIHSLGVDTNQYMGLNTLFDCFSSGCYSEIYLCPLRKTSSSGFFMVIRQISDVSLLKSRCENGY